MKKLDIKKLAGVGALSVGLVFGMAGFAGAQGGSGMISDTGNDSTNEIMHEEDTTLELTNENTLDLTNETDQTAESGDATVEDNRDGGDAMTGSAMNSSSVAADITVENTGSSAWSGAMGGGGTYDASIENTGNDSDNTVEYSSNVEMTVENTNNVTVENTTNQSATSGNAEVTNNRDAGSASSGAASNTSSSSFTVHVAN